MEVRWLSLCNLPDNPIRGQTLTEDDQTTEEEDIPIDPRLLDSRSADTQNIDD